MKNNSYHLFLFLITFTRGIVETFSLVLLYKKGYSLDNILLFLMLMYSFGIFVNYISLRFNYKVVLIISSLLYGISYLYLSFMVSNIINLIIFSLFLSFSTYSYHCLRHYLALVFEVKNTSLVVNIMFFGLIVASIVGTYVVDKLSIFWVSIILFVLSIISLVPIFKVDLKLEKSSNRVYISRRKFVFNIMEQFKVIFLELQPLFLYLYVNDSVSFVGGFNIIINISSLIVLFFLRKILVNKYYIYICCLLGGVLLFKISISNSVFLFFIAVIEGILVKLYERGSLSNLYDLRESGIVRYLMLEEFVFFGSKSIIMLIFLILGIKLKSILFICIVGIMVSGFVFNKAGD